jgi:hypothetical protein
VNAGDGLAAADVATADVAGPTAGLPEEGPTPVRAARAGTALGLVVWIARADAARGPANMSSVMLTAATTHTATATTAIAIPGLARMLAQLKFLIAGENLANHIDSAWRTARRRYATASLVVEVQQLNTCSRSSGGSGASGSRRENAAGRSAPHP